MFDDRRVVDTILDSGTVKYMGNQANKANIFEKI